MKIRLHMKNILYTAVKTLIGMKIRLHMKGRFIYRCKNINWYMKIHLYMKDIVIHCFKNINWYEDLFAYERRFSIPL